jgi:hypothetical protein
MSGYLQYSNYGDEDGTPAVPTKPSTTVQQKRTLRTNQRTLRSKQSLQRNPNPNPSQQPPQQQHKYVQELIQNIHSYENGGNASDSEDEDEDNNYVPLSNNSIPNSRSNAIHQQFQTEAVPNRNRFTGANSTDLNAKWNPAPAKEAFSLQDAKALASKYMPSVFQASNGSAVNDTDKDILLQKLDHIISLLEDQQDEKTGHVTEELVLYCFLGVFIIFIVDSFARAGKYVR